eukprot:14899-Pelagomonas_calceolata.AAC.2
MMHSCEELPAYYSTGEEDAPNARVGESTALAQQPSWPVGHRRGTHSECGKENPPPPHAVHGPATIAAALKSCWLSCSFCCATCIEDTAGGIQPAYPVVAAPLRHKPSLHTQFTHPNP